MWNSLNASAGGKDNLRGLIFGLILCTLFTSPIAAFSPSFSLNASSADSSLLQARNGSFEKRASVVRYYSWVTREFSKKAQESAINKYGPALNQAMESPPSLQTDMKGFLEKYDIKQLENQKLTLYKFANMDDEVARAAGINPDEKYEHYDLCSKGESKVCMSPLISADGKTIVIEYMKARNDENGAERLSAGQLLCYADVFKFEGRYAAASKFAEHLKNVDKILSVNLNDERYEEVIAEVYAKDKNTVLKGASIDKNKWVDFGPATQEYTVLFGTFNGAAYGTFLQASAAAAKRTITKFSVNYMKGQIMAHLGPFEKFKPAPPDKPAAHKGNPCGEGSSKQEIASRAVSGKKGHVTGKGGAGKGSTDSASCPTKTDGNGKSKDKTGKDKTSKYKTGNSKTGNSKTGKGKTSKSTRGTKGKSTKARPHSGNTKTHGTKGKGH